MGLTVLPVNTVSLVSSLPTSPFDGQEVAYLANATDGVVWHLKYRAASASAYKWEFVGGSKLSSSVVPGRVTDETTSATVFTGTQPATAGPALTLPLVGDYDIELDAQGYHNTVGNGAFMSFDVGATTALDNDGAYLAIGVASNDIQPLHRILRKTALAAATLTCKYRTNAGVLTIRGPRTITATPVRVG